MTKPLVYKFELSPNPDPDPVTSDFFCIGLLHGFPVKIESYLTDKDNKVYKNDVVITLLHNAEYETIKEMDTCPVSNIK